MIAKITVIFAIHSFIQKPPRNFNDIHVHGRGRVTPTGGKVSKALSAGSTRMSEYCKSLEGVAKQRYTKKINLLGLQEEDEPYPERSLLKFIDDLTLWPTVEYGHIFCYFVHNTKQELMQWKSLQAYNYFQSGLVDLNCIDAFNLTL